MQAELKALNPDLNIEVLGVNHRTDSAANYLVAMERTLPWLQETTDDPVWANWNVVYRDVRILDAQNRLVGVFNLTDNNLASSASYETLKQMFLAAAKAVDTDQDRLHDDWELKYFGNLSANPGDDSDGDRYDNFTEFVFGTNPKEAKSYLSLIPRLAVNGSERNLAVTFRRRAGAMVDYSVAATTDLDHWTASQTEVVLTHTSRNLFDGTGTLEAIYSLAKPTAGEPSGFLRVKAQPRQ